MDPMTATIQSFLIEFENFWKDSEARVLRVVMAPKDSGTLQKILRAAEWSPQNHSAFLIFEAAFTRPQDTFEAMCRVVTEHYALLRKGFAQQGISIPEFSLAFGYPLSVNDFSDHVHRFTKCLRDVLDPPIICWVPTDVRDDDGFVQAVIDILRSAGNPSQRFVFADEIGKERLADPLLARLGRTLVNIRFEVDEAALMAHFKKLMGPPSKGRAHGTLPGVAAPDVDPPPRPGPKPPTDEEIKAAIAAAGLPPVLMARESEQLRQLVIDAAQAAGIRDASTALSKQRDACELCATVGAKLEEAVMTMMLATYLMQFGHDAEAVQQYLRADQLAGDAKAYAQMAQARMALAYLHLKSRRIDAAVAAYEQAAAAALFGGVTLLYVESLRMAGTCHLQASRKREAYLCWRAAVTKGNAASADEIRHSSFLDVANSLIRLLERNGYAEQAKSVATIVQAAGERVAMTGAALRR